MKPREWICYPLLLAIFLGWTGTAAATVSTVHYQYAQTGMETLDFWLSRGALRMDFIRGERREEMLFRTDESPAALYVMNPRSRKAQKISEPGIRTFLEKFNRKLRAMFERLPDEEKRKLRRPGSGPPRARIVDLPPPRFQPTGTLVWKGKAATEGIFSIGGDTRGRGILLDDPPVFVRPGERSVLDSFHRHLVQFVGLILGIPGMQQTDGMARIENLLGLRQLRLAEYRSDGRRITLTRWERTPVPEERFRVPDGYRILTLESMVE